MTKPLQARRRRGAPIAHDPTAIRTARERADMLQVDLAAALGISPQLLNDIEHGRRNASHTLQLAIAEITGVRPERLAARRTRPPTRRHE